MMKNALITGGTGFLGKRLAYRLLEDGWQVTVYGRNESIGKQLTQSGIRFHRGDLLDAKEVIQACQNQDVVFHCAALSSPWGTYRDFYENNVVATQHVLTACHTNRIQRFVHVSTPSLYFDFTDRMNISESQPLPRKPANLYAKTKKIAEQHVIEAHEQGLPSIILRPRAIFGPGDTTLLPRLMHANHHGGIPLFRGGQIRMDLTYVDNVVNALILSAHASDEAMGKAYNITNQQPIILIDILEQLYEILGEPLHVRHIPYAFAYSLAGLMEANAKLFRTNAEPLFTRYTVGVLAKHQTLDNTLAIKKLGYKPRISIDEGLRRFAEWWRSET